MYTFLLHDGELIEIEACNLGEAIHTLNFIYDIHGFSSVTKG